MATTTTLDFLRKMTFFSDQSHILFYGCSSSSTHCQPIKAHRHTASSLSSSPPFTSQSPAHSHLDLITELAALKTQVKLKQKHLKAIAKEKKKALKKEKPKGKGKGKSSTSFSSSSSEASDGGSMPCSKRLLRRREDFLLQNMEVGVVKQEVGAVRLESHGLDHIALSQGKGAGTTQCELHLRSEQAYAQSAIPSYRDDGILGFPNDHSHRMSGIIEVCAGGKCKKAGSNQLLSSFKAQIPASAHVNTIPCKCLGRCGAAMNVKVRKAERNPQNHSHVSVDDVGLILSQHFGLDPPISGLPSFSSLSPPMP